MKTILSILGLCLALNLQAQSLTDSLLLYYRFDGNALDCSGNNFHGTASGVTDTLDRFGNSNSAYYFDGVNNYIDLPNVADLKPTDFPVTFSFWVKQKASGITNNAVLSTDFEQNDYHGYFMQMNNSNKLVLGYGSGYGSCSSSNRKNIRTIESMYDTTWKHIVGIVRGPNDMDLYVNCHLVASDNVGTGGPFPSYSATPGRIGALDASTNLSAYHFWGYMDEFAFWNRELSYTEISDICIENMSCIDSSSSGSPNDTTSSINDYKEFSPFKYHKSYIELFAEGEHVSVYNLLGECIAIPNKKRIYYSNLMTGIYILQIGESHHKVYIP
jgi:hypothetical protein